MFAPVYERGTGFGGVQFSSVDILSQKHKQQNYTHDNGYDDVVSARALWSRVQHKRP